MAFCSGVLRALATADWLEKVDYISCVSSGVLSAACFISQSTAQPLRRHDGAWEKVDSPSSGGGRRGEWTAEAAEASLSRQEDSREGRACRGLLLAERAERALHQLRRHCAPTTNPNFLATLHKIGVGVRVLALLPMTALAVATLIAASIENLLGSTLQTLLLSGLLEHPMGSVVFFGPLVLASLCWCCYLDPKLCLLVLPPLLLDDLPSLPSHQLPLLAGARALAPPQAQIAWFSACFLGSAWVVLLLMFLDERLLQGSMVDEVMQVLLFALWALAVVGVVSGKWQLQSGKDQRISTMLQAAQGFSVLWLTARICVVHVMGRAQGLHTYELACAALVLLLLLNDLASRLLHSLYKASLQTSFLDPCSNDLSRSSQVRSEPGSDGPGIGDIYYGGSSRMGAAAGSVFSVASAIPAPEPPSRFQPPQAALWLSDPERSSDPLLGELDTTCQPYILFNASSSGFVRKALPAYGMGRRGEEEQDRCGFLLSSAACGSERTGFFRPPSDLRLSDAIALAAGSRVFSSSVAPADSVLHDKFLLPVLWSGGWLRIPSREGAGAGGALRQAQNLNPTPNFFLDTTGSRPIPRRAAPSPLFSGLPAALMQCSWRWAAVVLVLCLLLSLITPALFLLPAGFSIALLLLSFLPEGHPLLFLPYLRAVHRVLGIVLHSDQPPPYLHVSDSGGMDPLGLYELLRRRCTTIFVCDSIPDPNNEFASLLNVLEDARRELRCAFVTPPDRSGDVSTLIREFQLNPEQRCLHLRVHYFARNLSASPSHGPAGSPPGPTATRRTENLQKVGSLWLLKSRCTPRDKTTRSSPPKSPAELSRAAGSGGQRVGGGGGSLGEQLRRWLPLCLLTRSPEPFDEEGFSLYATLGARAARAAMEKLTAQADAQRELQAVHVKRPDSPASSHSGSWTQGSEASFSGVLTSSLFLPSRQSGIPQ